MATTATPNQPRRRSQQPRVSVRAREGNGGERSNSDHDYDLLTAALIGITIGAGVTYMLRRGPSGRRPMAPIVGGVAKGAGWAGRGAMKMGGMGAKWAARRGAQAWDRVPRDEIREHVSDYMGQAREAIEDAVESELHDLRKAIRRQRKRLGV